MRNRVINVLLVILLLVPGPIQSAYALSMVLVTPRSPESPDGKWSTLVYSEAFKRLGWTFIYERYPSNRCGFLANRGKVDGVMERVYNYSNAFPNLIRVEESLRTLKFVAYARDPKIKLNNWTTLIGTNYLIDCRRGVKLCAHELKKYVNKENLFFVNSYESGLKRLIKGRTDLYVDFAPVINNAIRKGTVDRSLIHFSGVLHEIKVYPFLHKKHKKRAPALAKVLRELKKEGLLAEYWKKATRMK